MSATHDIAAMSMVCEDIAEAAHSDDITRDDAIAARLELLAHRTAVNATLSAVEARIGRAIEGQAVTEGGRTYTYVPARPVSYNHDKVIARIVDHVAEIADPKTAARVACELMAETYLSGSVKPKTGGLKLVDLRLPDVEREGEADGMKLVVKDVSKGGRR